jgi:HSP20 family protein
MAQDTQETRTDEGGRAVASRQDRRRAPIYDLRSEMEHLFDDVFRTGLPALYRRASGNSGGFGVPMPQIDIIDKDTEVKLIADVPGMREEDIHIDLAHRVLTISGEKREETEEGDENGERHVRERHYGAFRRSFTLPESIERDRIDASLRNGVLTVRLPKSEDTHAEKRSIEVKAET